MTKNDKSHTPSKEEGGEEEGIGGRRKRKGSELNPEPGEEKEEERAKEKELV